MPPTQPDQQTFCVDLLSNNATDQFIEAANVLLKIANNIVRDPENVKYRTIRLSNATVVNKLLPVNGAMECLFEMGFEEDNDGLHLKLPSTSSLKQLKLISEQISSKLDSQKATRSDKKSDPPSSLETTTSSDQMFRSEQLFYNKLVNNMQHVKIYEDRVMQEKAKYLMPVERLQYEAHRQWSELTESGKKNPELNMPDLLLLRLLSWFKREFFSWMDSPKCNSCSGKTVGCGQDTPSSDELHWDAHTIELYRCKTCNAITRFPRYNNPGKLLETRTGRCGEWANCFTLCCRAIGFDSRYVLDWTDHVWTEVYSLGQKRWLHCDPCENVCDSPLTYDVGWKKELTYVIAFSKDEIQDVTWRYVQDHTAVMQRRRECRESWLVQTISKINKEMRILMSSDKRDFLSKRFVLEIAEFMSPSKVKESDKDGRTSGSLAWRLARGETEAISDESKPYTFQPTSHEKQMKRIHVKYSASSDRYVRVSDRESVIRGWHECTHESKSMFRKVESDWNMVYLARNEGSKFGTITWNFDVTSTGLSFKDATIRVIGTTFQSGRLMLTLCSGDKCTLIDHDKENRVTEFVRGTTQLLLTARLSHGNGDVSWQHAQLFRQKMDSKEFLFEVILELE